MPTSSQGFVVPPATSVGALETRRILTWVGAVVIFFGAQIGAQSLGAPMPGAQSPSRQSDGTSFGTGLDSSNIRVTNASDARVQVGGPRTVAGGDDDLDDLEVERVRLQGLAAQLKKMADELQQRASKLK